jgi:hypothetical protein
MNWRIREFSMRIAQQSAQQLRQFFAERHSEIGAAQIFGCREFGQGRLFKCTCLFVLSVRFDVRAIPQNNRDDRTDACQ